FLNNWPVKLSAFLFAIILWLYVITENEYVYVMQIPIEFTMISADKVLAEEYDLWRSVKLRGNGKSLLALIINKGGKIEIDMRSVDTHFNGPASPEMVHIPRGFGGIKPIQILEPSPIDVYLTRIIDKKVPVVPQVEVTPMAGHILVDGIQFKPDSVLLTGPENRLQTINAITTDTRELTDVSQKRSLKVPLQLPEIPHLRTDAKEIEFSLNVQKLMEKTIEWVPIDVRNVPTGVKVIVMPPNLSLVLEGGFEQLAKISAQNIRAYIDYTRPREKKETGHPAFIETPEGIYCRDVNPEFFKVVLVKD
ncbi:YbbR-like domain-containing protein, partial [bacterium]|nr:YbbR-like domain-containing protein [bacterium]